MTDEQMDARLRDAGARWRAATPVLTLAPADPAEANIVPAIAVATHRRRTWFAAVTGVAVAAAVVIGVAVTGGDNGTPQPAGQPDLAGTTWQLNGVNVAGVPHTANLPTISENGRTPLTFARTGDRISFSDGCNFSDGRVEIRGTQLVLGNLARTEIGCPSASPSVAAIDRVFVGTVDWTITGGRLVITKPGVGSLTYATLPVLRPSTDPAKLVGVTWGLSGVEHDTANGGSGSGSSDSTSIRLTFDGRGGYRVDEPCGPLAGSVTLSSGSADFSKPVRPTHSCPATGSIDPAFTTAVAETLSGRTTWSILDGTLTITKGTTKLTFTDQPTSDQAGPSGSAEPPATTLRGTTWLLAAITSPKLRQTLDTTKTKLKLTIDKRGSLSVDDGVNFHSVPNDKPVGITADTITLTDLSTTLAGCAGANELCTRAQVVSDVFAGTIGWVIQNGHLELMKGDTTLTYVRA